MLENGKETREIATETTETATERDIGTERRGTGKDCANEKKETGKILKQKYFTFHSFPQNDIRKKHSNGVKIR